MATKSLFKQILENGIELVQRPLIEKRVRRAFESANDSIEEQIMETDNAILKTREELINNAKNKGNLNADIQALVDLQIKLESLQNSKTALEREKTQFMGE